MNTWNANEARELSPDELSAVTGGGGQCTNNSGPSWGQIAGAARGALAYYGAAVTGGVSGPLAQATALGIVTAAKELAQ